MSMAPETKRRIERQARSVARWVAKDRGRVFANGEPVYHVGYALAVGSLMDGWNETNAEAVR